jgi:hypothetical protein
VGTPTFAADQKIDGSHAARFAGTQGATTSTMPITDTHDYTVSTWFNWDGPRIGKYGVEHQMLINIMGKSRAAWYLGINGNYIAVTTPGSETMFPSQCIPQVGTWTHVAVVNRPGPPSSFSKEGAPTSAFEVYVNGRHVFVGQDRGPGNKPEGAIQFGGNNLGGGLTGFMDDTRIYNRALSHEEIVALYRDGKKL